MCALVSAPGAPAMMMSPAGLTVRGWQDAQSVRVIVGRCGENAGGRPWHAAPHASPPVAVHTGARSTPTTVSALNVAPPP